MPKTKAASRRADNGASLADLDITEHGDEPRPLDLIDPRDRSVVTRNGKPWRVYVLSVHSTTMATFYDSQIDRNARKGGTITAAIQRERSIASDAELLMGKAWENIPDEAGGDLAWNRANAKMLLTRLPWARQQIAAFALEERNFLPELPPTSPSSDGMPSD